MSDSKFFDLQVNGFGGIDFNGDSLSADDLHRACELIAATGVTGFLATFITNDVEVMAARIARLVAARAQDELARSMIAGLHVEGPFLNPVVGYRGAHPRQHICPPTLDKAKRLLDAGVGLVRLLTLAPEKDRKFKVTEMAARQGIVVSAGHTNATIDQLQAAADAGLTMFTHVGNGCPAKLPRHDNIIQRALHLRGRLWLCFIADGVHVPLPALGNYLRSAGLERSLVVTDAIAPAGLGQGRFPYNGGEVVIGPDMVARAPDGPHLLGSVATMRQCHDNLIGPLGLSAEQVRTLTAVNPRKAVGL